MNKNYSFKNIPEKYIYVNFLLWRNRPIRP